MPSEQHEEWHKVHAQLLKSVADAQGRLLAAQNETNDRLERMQSKLLAGINEITDRLDKLSEYSTHNLELAEKRINGRLDVFNVRLDATNSILEALLACRPVERLHTKRIVKETKQRKRTR